MLDLFELDLTIKELEAHPELHFQSRWLISTPCGTGGCLAGTVALRAGWKPVNWSDEWNVFGAHYVGTYEVQKDGVIREVRDVACEILGVSGSDANWLFGGANTIEDIKNIRDQLAQHDTEPE